MMLLITKALPQVLEWGDGRIGRLLTPRHYSRSFDTGVLGIPWAADNDAFSGFDERKFVQMLDVLAVASQRLEDIPLASRCLFVTCPDVVGDPVATRKLWEQWADKVRARGLPPALVAQDGLEPDEVPWADIAGLFVGGTDAWKCSPGAEAIVREAAERGVHVHAGRVNSVRRARTFAAWGAGSMDGSMFSQWSDRWVPWFLARMPDGSQGALDLRASP